MMIQVVAFPGAVSAGRVSRSTRAAVRRALASSCVALTVFSTALAEGNESDQPFSLGAIEVIGQRETAAAPMTTDKVDATRIAEYHRNDLSQALDLVPGVSVQNLGQRRERLISVRGFSSRQVPLYIDGIPVYVPYDGNVDLARFGVDYISEIVVGRGLASLLYGPNILGGVVNVISRKPSQPLEFSARVATEADDRFDVNEQRVSASLGGVQGMWYGSLNASYVNSMGYRLPDDFVPVAAENGARRNNADSHDSLVTAKIGFQPNEYNEYALSFYRQRGEKQDPPYAGSYITGPTRPDGVQARFWRWPYWDKQSVYLVARNAVTDQGTFRWRAFYDTFKNALESFDSAAYTTQVRPYAFHGSNYDDFTYGASGDFEWSWSSAHTTRVAAHFRRDVHRESQITPIEPLEHLSIPTYDVTIEHEWRVIDSLTLTPSYSHMVQPHETAFVYNSTQRIFSPVETNKQSADNAQLVANYTLSSANSLVAGVSQKTRFPTIKERFSGGLGSALPNPGLEPERALHYEVGYQHKAGNWDAKIALFQSRLHDAIQQVTLSNTVCSAPPCSQLRNVGTERDRGFELSFNYLPIETLQLSGQFTYLDRNNLSSPNIRLLNTPQDKYMLAGNWQFLPKWEFKVDAQHESSRFSNTTGTRVAGAFTLVNSFVRFEPTTHVGIEVGGRNLTDKLYAYEEGYYESGRTWLAQLDYRY